MKTSNTIIKIKKFYFLLCWSFFIFYVTTFPAEQSYSTNTGYLDKIFHSYYDILFGAIGIILSLIYIFYKNKNKCYNKNDDKK